MSTKPRVWLITGCSSGFGRSLAERALERGDRVVATARDVTTLEALKTRFGDRACTLPLDVTRPDQVHAAIEGAKSAFGRIDILVNNAGYGLQSTLEDASDAQIRAVFEANVFGPLAVTRAALPLLRAQRSGHIVNISSVGGRLSGPFIGLYSATKFALEGFSIAAAAELAPLGIKLTVVEPGAFATRFGSATSLVSVPPSESYAPLGEGLAATFESLKWGDPRDAAAAIIAACDSPEPPLRLVLGQHALNMVRQTLQAQLEELARWEPLSNSASPA